MSITNWLKDTQERAEAELEKLQVREDALLAELHAVRAERQTLNRVLTAIQARVTGTVPKAKAKKKVYPRSAPSQQTLSKMAQAMRDGPPTFSVPALMEATGMPSSRAYTAIGAMRKDGVIGKAGVAQGKTGTVDEYRILDEQAIDEMIGQSALVAVADAA